MDRFFHFRWQAADVRCVRVHRRVASASYLLLPLLLMVAAGAVAGAAYGETDTRGAAGRAAAVEEGAGNTDSGADNTKPVEYSLSGMDCIVQPSRIVELGSAVPGLLEEVKRDRSDTVSAGEVIATLESSVEEVVYVMAREVARHSAALELRKVGASFGERTRGRNASLTGDLAVSEQVMDQLRTEAAVASLQVQQEEENRTLALLEKERAKADLLRRRIVSPIDGVVTERYHSSGEYVDGDPVFQLATLDPLHVEVIVPIEYRRALNAGQMADIRIEAPGFDGQALVATVERIDVVADAASATYGLRLTLPNPEMAIPGGVRCTVDFRAP